jgi:hypothetical protein
MDIAAASYIVMQYLVKNKKRKQRHWWQTQLYTGRSVYSGRQLLLDLKFHEISGQI